MFKSAQEEIRLKYNGYNNNYLVQLNFFRFYTKIGSNSIVMLQHYIMRAFFSSVPRIATSYLLDLTQWPYHPSCKIRLHSFWEYQLEKFSLIIVGQCKRESMFCTRAFFYLLQLLSCCWTTWIPYKFVSVDAIM